MENNKAISTPRSSSSSSIRYYIGMIMASCFSMVYFVAPFYMLTAMFALLLRYPTSTVSWIYCSPIFISAILPVPTQMSTRILRIFAPILDYFIYDEIYETKPIDVSNEILNNNKNYLFICQPHGALSYVGITFGIAHAVKNNGVDAKIPPTAVADAVLKTPIVKHVLGLFGLISASKKSIQNTFKTKKGVDGSIVLYVGGLAELFLSCENEEQLYLHNRKGFIKLALSEGVDVVPCYLFGNTYALSVLKHGILASISRKLQISLTYIWGKYGLPIPRNCTLLYVQGQPLGIPYIPKPTQNDIDTWHTKYCNEVERIYNTYKERVPEYKHKKLHIV